MASGYQQIMLGIWEAELCNFQKFDVIVFQHITGLSVLQIKELCSNYFINMIERLCSGFVTLVALLHIFIYIDF